MKIKIIVLLAFIALPLFSLGQKIHRKTFDQPTEKDDSIAVENYKCTYRNLFSAKKRLLFYPFNVAKKIILISYNDTSEVMNKTPVVNRKIMPRTIKETITLNDTQIDSLTSILYNITSKPNDSFWQIADPGASCYQPRNSILFLNENDRVLDFIEICFECGRTEYSSKRIKRFQNCESKYDILKAFFISTGTKYGTITTD
ncbi:MAG: hypothetical protein EOO87_04505 [Pedobacter sp.]|nr:MAG: hypothetical protein EOO87_04505 [Pedobacter sp.]